MKKEGYGSSYHFCRENRKQGSESKFEEGQEKIAILLPLIGAESMLGSRLLARRKLRWKSFEIVAILNRETQFQKDRIFPTKGDVEDGVSGNHYPDRAEKREAGTR
ncbi:hypothetical protein [Brevibacillus sp. SAFN-007a]|uniref:hypothetical protein n=1 Tax=Brevibacillus sp. SAFN-007a TaxID=3436862 RepID=UPI003F8143F6